jgi:hypothetical protein
VAKLAVEATSVQVFEDDPQAIGLWFECADIGPYCFVALEQAFRPDPKDGRYGVGQTSLDLDLGPPASMDCTPGAVKSARLTPGRLELQIQQGVDPKMGDFDAIEIRFPSDAAMAERIQGMLELLLGDGLVVGDRAG